MNKTLRFSVPFIIACILLGMMFHLVGATRQVRASVTATDLVVNTLEDEVTPDDNCSLREAIQAANTNTTIAECGTGDVLTDTITFNVAGIINLASQLEVTGGGPIIIDGDNKITTSGGGLTRVWWVETGSELILQHMAVIEGYSEGSGAGLYNNDASVTVDQCEFIGNHISGDVVYGGGIYNIDGTLIISDSLIEGNSIDDQSVYGFGGAIAIQGGTGVISRSTIEANQALGQCDMYFVPGGGGVWISNATLNIIDSTFHNNVDPCGGGGIANYEGGSLTVTGSTFTGNSSNIGGGIISLSLDGFTIANSTLSGNHMYEPDPINKWGGGIAQWNGNVTMTNCTVNGNSSGLGGGIFSDNGTFTAINSILSNNTAVIGGDCWMPIVDGGYNLSSDDSCGFDPANGSLPGTDPLLGSLQDNGGPTWTHALLEGSPAIDVGDDTLCPPTDQRGYYRPQDGDADGVGICDIGSFELALPGAPILVTITGPITGSTGVVHSFTATVEPISSTLPITFTWQASEHPPITRTMGLTDTAGWGWEIPGIKTITVTASNSEGTVMDTHVIDIISPLIEVFLPIVVR